ncbi:MAG: hypothetical protein ACKVUT_17450 [Gaiella sp.]
MDTPNSTTASRRGRTWTLAGVTAALTLGAALLALLAPVSGSAVSQALPDNTAEPRISGSAVEGGLLTTTNGKWTGDPTSFEYEWRRCPAGGGASDASNCERIDGATSGSYTLREADVGKRMRARVTATNADGSATATSNATAAVRSATPTGAPTNTALPAVSGAPIVGRTVRSSAGTWTGRQPITYAFQWLRCDQGGNDCVTLANATDDAYVVREGDAGKTLRARVQASNSAGTARALSKPTAAVTGNGGPEGAIRLPSGETSIPASSVPATERLVVDRVEFTPSVVRSRTETIQSRIKVKDTRGYVVRDAIVFIRSTPVVTSGGDDRRTGQDGWITYDLEPQRDFPALDPRYAVQFYVKAYRAGDPVLAGVAGTRLVQVQLGGSTD